MIIKQSSRGWNFEKKQEKAVSNMTSPEASHLQVEEPMANMVMMFEGCLHRGCVNISDDICFCIYCSEDEKM